MARHAPIRFSCMNCLQQAVAVTLSPRKVSGGAGVTLPSVALLPGRTPMQDKDEGDDDPDEDGYTRFVTASGIDSSTTCNFCRKGPNDWPDRNEYDDPA